MDFETMLSAISTVGYPIVMSLLLLYFVKNESDSHKSEIDSLRDTLERNTLAVTKLLQHLGVDDEK